MAFDAPAFSGNLPVGRVNPGRTLTGPGVR